MTASHAMLAEMLGKGEKGFVLAQLLRVGSVMAGKAEQQEGACSPLDESKREEVNASVRLAFSFPPFYPVWTRASAFGVCSFSVSPLEGPSGVHPDMCPR